MGAYSAPPDPLAGFKGPTSKGRGGRGREKRGREGEEGRGRDRGGKGGLGEAKENGNRPPTIFGLKVALMCYLLRSVGKHDVSDPSSVVWSHVLHRFVSIS